MLAQDRSRDRISQLFIPGYLLVRLVAITLHLLSQACEHHGVAALCAASLHDVGGAYRDRTDDLMLAKQPLSQLS